MISKDQIIRLDNGLSAFLLQNCVETVTLPNPEDADLWIINTDRYESIKNFLYAVINSEDPSVFLKPVFLNKNIKKKIAKHHHTELKNLCDGYTDNLDVHNKLAAIHYIINYTKPLQGKENTVTVSDVLMKTLLYYSSRNRDIVITENAQSLTGYVYPRLEAYVSDLGSPFKRTHELLSAGMKKGFLKRQYVDTLHLCNKCSSGFLNYREECPSCKGHNLQVRSLIHHYRCAFVGSEDLFKKGDQLQCPKCSTMLVNVGVDYDRPGKVYRCKAPSCAQEFQKPEIGVRCINCKKEQSPFDLKVEKIYNYALTQEASDVVNSLF